MLIYFTVLPCPNPQNDNYKWPYRLFVSLFFFIRVVTYPTHLTFSSRQVHFKNQICSNWRILTRIWYLRIDCNLTRNCSIPGTPTWRPVTSGNARVTLSSPYAGLDPQHLSDLFKTLLRENSQISRFFLNLFIVTSLELPRKKHWISYCAMVPYVFYNLYL